MMLYDAHKKSAAIAFLLWFFLGGLGAHRFYTGRAGSAVAMIGLNVLGWITLAFLIGFGLLAAFSIWWLVDAFLIGGWIRRHNANLIERLERDATNGSGD